jgi:predicted nucleic acid-binding protein
VKFWDASAIVPLLVNEETTRRLQAVAAKDSAMLVWWGSAVECISALARLERDDALDPPAMTLALQRLRQLSAGWHEIDPSDEIRETEHDFSASIRCVPPMHCNWPRPSLPPSGDQHHWK